MYLSVLTLQDTGVVMPLRPDSDTAWYCRQAPDMEGPAKHRLLQLQLSCCGRMPSLQQHKHSLNEHVLPTHLHCEYTDGIWQVLIDGPGIADAFTVCSRQQLRSPQAQHTN